MLFDDVFPEGEGIFFAKKTIMSTIIAPTLSYTILKEILQLRSKSGTEAVDCHGLWDYRGIKH